MKVVEGLNEAQREAVCHGDTPLLVLAGAGSGKTRVIVHRIAYLIEEVGVAPGSILAVTFTNRAADEMQERVDRLLRARPEGMWLGTFHSVCVRILRREGKKTGFPDGFTIYDRDDSLRLIKSIATGATPGTTPREISGYLEKISSHKSNLVFPADVPEKGGSESVFLRDLYAAYQENLKASNALDFDDLIMKVVELFIADPDTLESYRRRFTHILVDEYQDTNYAQYRLVSLLAGDSGGLYVVGDDDQSIYGWRGADIRNILEFEKDFPEARSIVLDVNYRSTEVILNAASGMISHNRGRKPKELRADRDSGEKIALYRAKDDREEAKRIADTIRASYLDDGFSFGDFAVLYRTNAQSRLIEDALRSEDIPHVIIGSLSFYRRKEIKDLLAYLRVIVNPADTLDLLRIANVPPRGIGQKAIGLIKGYAGEHACSHLEAMDRMVDDGILRGARADKMAGFCKLMGELIELAAKENLLLVIMEVLERTGYTKYLEDAGTSDSRGRLENVDEFVRSAEEFALSCQQQGREASLSDFLERTALNEDWDDAFPTGGGVSLLTLHNAKGLEFPFVFVTGLEEGLLPWSGNGIAPRDEVEEERRLFYVGMTRARTRLHLSYAMQRMNHGQVTRSVPSRFLEEIPRDVTNVIAPERTTHHRRHSWSTGTGVVDPVEEAGSLFAGSFGKYGMGERIYHCEFGGGVVVGASGYGEKLKLTIEFDFCGRKKIYPGYTNLRKESDPEGDYGG